MYVLLSIILSIEGQAVTIVVGGLSEMMMTAPGKHRLKLKHRHGFIKLALAEGSAMISDILKRFILAFGISDHLLRPTITKKNRARSFLKLFFVKIWQNFSFISVYLFFSVPISCRCTTLARTTRTRPSRASVPIGWETCRFPWFVISFWSITRTPKLYLWYSE